MTNSENHLLSDYMISGNNIGDTDVFDAVGMLIKISGEDIIDTILNNRDCIRPVITKDIPQFSEERDVYSVIRILLDSGLNDLTYEQIGTYLCPVDSKKAARRKYGETHYKFANQLGLTSKDYPLSTTEIGVAYYLLENDKKRQELMSRLVFSIPIVQHVILEAKEERIFIPSFLSKYLSPSTAIRRRSNLHKIMSWACDITSGENKQLFDNIVWY